MRKGISTRGREGISIRDREGIPTRVKEGISTTGKEGFFLPGIGREGISTGEVGRGYPLLIKRGNHQGEEGDIHLG